MNQIKACCGNCGLWLQQPESERGICVRHPPTVVAMPEQKRDIVTAQMGVEWVLKAVRPSTSGGEVCGEFRQRMVPQSVQ